MNNALRPTLRKGTSLLLIGLLIGMTTFFAQALNAQLVIFGPQPNTVIKATEGTEMKLGSSQMFLLASGGTGEYTWEVDGIPPGLEILFDEDIENFYVGGTVDDGSAGEYPVDVTLTDEAMATVSVSVLYKIFESVEMKTDSLPDATRQEGYGSVLLEAEFGVPPYEWKDVSEDGDLLGLPEGLGIKKVTLPANSPNNPSADKLVTAQIQGIPKYQALPGTYKVTLEVTDDSDSSAIQEIEIELLPGVHVPPLTVHSKSALQLINAIEIDPVTITAQGGTPPYDLDLTSDLPPGLTLQQVDEESWQLSGTPALTDADPLSYNVEVEISDETYSPLSTTLDIRVDVDLKIVVQAPENLPPAQEGVLYEPEAFLLFGDYQAVSLDLSSDLPAGLTFVDGNDGTIRLEGTPASFTASNDIYPIDLVVESENAWGVIVQGEYSFELRVAPQPVKILTSLLPQAAPDQSYLLEPTSVGGIYPITWEAFNLPQGLALVFDDQTDTYRIEGTVESHVSGGHIVVLIASDSSTDPLQDAVILQLSVVTPTPSPLSIQTTFLPPAESGVAYGPLPLVAGGGTPPYTWQAEAGFPPGLEVIEDENGVFSLQGTLEASLPAGAYQLALLVQDSAGNQASGIYTLITFNPSIPNDLDKETSSTALALESSLAQAAASCSLTKPSQIHSVFHLLLPSCLLLAFAAWIRKR